MQNFILGLAVGAFLTSILFALLNRSSRAEKKEDPADWWKNGGEPPNPF
jgi:hypothetical protein